jgi:Predicted HKD family nuclease
LKVLSNKEYILGNDRENKLLNEVLIEFSRNCDTLHILSGYATSSMMKRHLELLDALSDETNCKVKIHLIIGMIPQNGLSTIEHEGFKSIISSRHDIECSYVMTGRPATHAKTYIWLKSGIPQKAFIGSANYSQNAFFGNQVETMASVDPFLAEEFFQSYSSETAYCNIDEIEDMVNIVSENEFRKRIKNMEKNIKDDKNIVTLSLLTAQSKVGDVSSLNWGQRPKREPNQAYISIPRSIGKSGFFPPKETIFTVMADDGIIFQCVTAGNKKNEPPKQIETSKDNSELGRYFRNRMNIPLGKKITLDDLNSYGRTNVVFVNLGDGTYYMDFSKPSKHDIILEK